MKLTDEQKTLINTALISGKAVRLIRGSIEPDRYGNQDFEVVSRDVDEWGILTPRGSDLLLRRYVPAGACPSVEALAALENSDVIEATAQAEAWIAWLRALAVADEDDQPGMVDSILELPLPTRFVKSDWLTTRFANIMAGMDPQIGFQKEIIEATTEWLVTRFPHANPDSHPQDADPNYWLGWVDAFITANPLAMQVAMWLSIQRALVKYNLDDLLQELVERIEHICIDEVAPGVDREDLRAAEEWTAEWDYSVHEQGDYGSVRESSLERLENRSRAKDLFVLCRKKDCEWGDLKSWADEIQAHPRNEYYMSRVLVAVLKEPTDLLDIDWESEGRSELCPDNDTGELLRDLEASIRNEEEFLFDGVTINLGVVEAD
jgi:hypothetical protein